ncbi:ALG6, ALG8 glycosyltransferase family isoform X2 [Wolffia australiana]
MEEATATFFGTGRARTAAVALFALLVRAMVAMGPYSGRGNPPMYGDYEAQRHWMEITIHTPVAEWYRNTSANDLRYWGLDYPPLTAYQSYVHGLLFLQPFVPESVALFLSRGFESDPSKLLMRWTVLSSDLAVFFPAAIFFVVIYFGRRIGSSGGFGPAAKEWLLAMILLNPCLILIDHGHFQYNCISLGCAIGAVAAIIDDHDLVGSFLFCLSLNHKQMSAYYAPAFFAHLLGKCLRQRNPVLAVMRLGFIVLGTFTLIWWPYLYSLDAVREVLSRLAPFERGIYEDYVSNFWCATSILIKWKHLFLIKSLKIFSLCATAISFLPSMIQQIKSPSKHGFLFGLLNSSFAFYLFSYQASLLALEEPVAFIWLINHAMFSMLPLLLRDGLWLQYFGLLVLFDLIYLLPIEGDKKRRCLPWKLKAAMAASVSFSALLHLAYLILQPPKRYPFLFEALIMNACFYQFVILVLYFNFRQWALQYDASNKKMQ